LIKILIVGLGTIGIRHFESLYNSNLNLSIDCMDCSVLKLEKIENFIKKKKNKKKIKLFSSLTQIDQNYDFLIHSTSSDVRLKTLIEILRNSKIKYSILEKILVQSLEDLKDLDNLCSKFKKSWVNTPMHELELYKKIKKRINVEDLKSIEFNYFEGLACNSIHFIDFVSSWKNLLPCKIDTTQAGKWYVSKRKGFMDLFGKLTIFYPDKTKLILKSFENRLDYHCIINEKKKWKLIEREKCFYSDDGIKESGEVEFQSQLTSTIVNKILSFEKCDLPLTQWSVKCHEILIKSLLNYWNSYNKGQFQNKNKFLPIT
jgi:hypothetical protein